jgi:hypothetical protein
MMDTKTALVWVPFGYGYESKCGRFETFKGGWRSWWVLWDRADGWHVQVPTLRQAKEVAQRRAERVR